MTNHHLKIKLFSSSPAEDLSEELIKVRLTVRTQAECRRSINQRTDPKLQLGILDGQLCAGGGTAQDTCQVSGTDFGMCPAYMLR